MKFALASTLLLCGSAAAFNVTPEKKNLAAANKNLVSVMAAGVIGAATLMPLAPAVAADSLILGTPLQGKLENFGSSSYSVFNSVSDVNPLAQKFVEFIDKKIKAPDTAEVAQKAVEGLLAIPDSAINEYRGVLKQVVYSGVSKDNCVTLGGSGEAAKTLANSAAIKSLDSDKIAALKTKFNPANSAVPTKDGNLCLPGSVAASEKLWVAQAELTSSMPKAEAKALADSIKKAGAQIPRTAIATLVPSAESAFSKSPEAKKMADAGKDVEPSIIAIAAAALK